MTRRVLLWHWGRRGGGPRYTLELARAMAARGDLEVHLSYSRDAEIRAEYEALGLPGLPVDTYRGALHAAVSSLRLPLIRRRFGRYIRDHGIDTVIGTMNHVWDVAVAPVIRPAGARFLFVLHDGLFHPGEENAFRDWSIARQIRLSDAMVTLSGHVRTQLTDLHGYPPERSRV
ncbi:glycosyltransferase family 4 protein, partial [Azospirillum sp.]|uniref:glycosyltransferase family 4 protein n=1 Tax=Azospirillum sp. TaxID=34012 RepID=UPI002D298B5B